jgi:hypothetical protein
MYDPLQEVANILLVLDHADLTEVSLAPRLVLLEQLHGMDMETATLVLVSHNHHQIHQPLVIPVQLEHLVEQLVY